MLVGTGSHTTIHGSGTCKGKKRQQKMLWVLSTLPRGAAPAAAQIQLLGLSPRSSQLLAWGNGLHSPD